MKQFLNAVTQTKTDAQTVLKCIDMHTGGEPLRVVLSGFAPLFGKRIVDKRQNCLAEQDHLRTAIMGEPRGHSDMYGALITEPEREDSDFGVLFLHNEGYSTMCGHAIIALATLAEKSGYLTDNKELKIDSPAGQVHAFYDNNQAYFDNVASYVVALDHVISHSMFGQIKCDIAFGGAFYAYVDADKLDVALTPENATYLSALGEELKAQVNKTITLTHPEDAELSFLYGVIFYSNSQTSQADSHSKHVCIFADGELDRSPTGTGVSARAAILHARDQLQEAQPIHIESIVNSRFSVQVQNKTQFHQYDAITPRVFGEAHITGKSEFILESDDPFKHGFFLK